MSDESLPVEGSADAEVCRMVHEVWVDAARRAGTDLTGFDPGAPLEERLAWAARMGLEVGAVLSRFSKKMQHSTAAQVRDCVKFAAGAGVYTPPEFVCVDEAISGRKRSRAGVERARLILKQKRAGVLLVFKLSRLFRSAYRGFAFIQEEIVDRKLRAISVTQSIDTGSGNGWKKLAYLHGIMDEDLLDAIADHVRAGLKDLFDRGYVTGALPVGYHAVVVEGGAPTRLGRPRRAPAVSASVAAMIRQHYEWVRDGMSLSEGWRRWVDAGGPTDPRSRRKVMSPKSYRSMLSNPRYIGIWAFGRLRNAWDHKGDRMRQDAAPKEQVIIRRVEEYRILEDELFFGVQARLLALRKGPRGPRKKKDVRLWDLVTGFYVCARCGERFYVHGAYGHSMTCKNGGLCPCPVTVRREEAARAVSAALAELVRRDVGLCERVVGRALEVDAAAASAAAAEIPRLEARVIALVRRIDVLLELAGEGSDEDRADLKKKVRAVQAEKAAVQAELARLRRVRDGGVEALTPERVRAELDDLAGLLEAGAAGELGEDVVHRTARLFGLLVGGRIEVHVERRAGRKRTNVRGRFRPDLVGAVRVALDRPAPAGPVEAAEVWVWLRKPPRKDELAERVHQLIDVEGESFRSAADVLQREGHKVNSGVVWQIYYRYYEMRGEPVPPRPYNGGRPRRAARPRR
jgi:hypothetical protein